NVEMLGKGWVEIHKAGRATRVSFEGAGKLFVTGELAAEHSHGHARPRDEIVGEVELAHDRADGQFPYHLITFLDHDGRDSVLDGRRQGGTVHRIHGWILSTARGSALIGNVPARSPRASRAPADDPYHAAGPLPREEAPAPRDERARRGEAGSQLGVAAFGST